MQISRRTKDILSCLRLLPLMIMGLLVFASCGDDDSDSNSKEGTTGNSGTNIGSIQQIAGNWIGFDSSESYAMTMILTDKGNGGIAFFEYSNYTNKYEDTSGALYFNYTYNSSTGILSVSYDESGNYGKEQWRVLEVSKGKLVININNITYYCEVYNNDDGGSGNSGGGNSGGNGQQTQVDAPSSLGYKTFIYYEGATTLSPHEMTFGYGSDVISSTWNRYKAHALNYTYSYNKESSTKSTLTVYGNTEIVESLYKVTTINEVYTFTLTFTTSDSGSFYCKHFSNHPSENETSFTGTFKIE